MNLWHLAAWVIYGTCLLVIVGSTILMVCMEYKYRRIQRRTYKGITLAVWDCPSGIKPGGKLEVLQASESDLSAFDIKR